MINFLIPIHLLLQVVIINHLEFLGGVVEAALAVADHPQFFMVGDERFELSGELLAFDRRDAERLVVFCGKAGLPEVASVFRQGGGLL